jgi:hypothetical protein
VSNGPVNGAWNGFDPSGVHPPRLRDLPEEKRDSPRILSAVARGVFGVLSEFANRKEAMWPPWVPRDQAGWLAWPSVPSIAAISGLSDRAVRIALSELEHASAVQCVYRSKGGAAGVVDGKWQPVKTNAYLLTPHLVQGSTGAQKTKPNGRRPSVRPMAAKRGHLSNPARQDREPCTSRQRTLHVVHENPARGAANVFNYVFKEGEREVFRAPSAPPEAEAKAGCAAVSGMSRSSGKEAAARRRCTRSLSNPKLKNKRCGTVLGRLVQRVSS